MTNRKPVLPRLEQVDLAQEGAALEFDRARHDQHDIAFVVEQRRGHQHHRGVRQLAFQRRRYEAFFPGQRGFEIRFPGAAERTPGSRPEQAGDQPAVRAERAEVEQFGAQAGVRVQICLHLPEVGARRLRQVVGQRGHQLFFRLEALVDERRRARDDRILLVADDVLQVAPGHRQCHHRDQHGGRQHQHDDDAGQPDFERGRHDAG
jgi:hypothetical protein